ncbi:MAG: hypothetical protein LBT00_01635 [Spirochaetaceae bacterium]|nr:hypothetical protein [Spirochaetaceae bacterium]
MNSLLSPVKPIVIAGKSPRHCERSEAIQREGLLRLDCFTLRVRNDTTRRRLRRNLRLRILQLLTVSSLPLFLFAGEKHYTSGMGSLFVCVVRAWSAVLPGRRILKARDGGR